MDTRSAMRVRLRARWLAAGGVGATALVLTTVIAFASIPGPGGVINGCYGSTSGKLRVIDSSASCAKSEVALNWNQVGPAGPAGPVGPPPASYQATVGDFGMGYAVGNLTASLSVPAGTYVVTWSFTAQNMRVGGTDDWVYCGPTFSPAPTAVAHLAAQGSAGDTVTISKTYRVTLASAGSVQLWCHSQSTTGFILATDTHLVATLVTAAN